MTSEELAGIAGALLSLALTYIPGLNERFAALDAQVKRLVMLGLLVLASLAVFALACGGLAADLGLALTCDKAGALALLRALAAAVIANQGVYQISPRPRGVQQAAQLARHG